MKKWFCLLSFFMGYAVVNAQPAEPVLLQPNIVSNNAVFGYTLSPNAKQALWVQSNNGRRDTLFIWEASVKKENHRHKKPASFSIEASQGKWKDIDPMFSPDGKTLYFQSNRPVPGMPNRKGFDIWAVTKLENGKWSPAFHLGNAVNTDSSESYSSVSSNGNMYFTVAHNGLTDIYMAPFENGKYLSPIALPAIINQPGERESNPFIAADESFLIYFSTGKDGLGEVDLYISFRKNGAWQTPVNLDRPINSALAEFCPFYHAGQKRLYFSRQQKQNGGMLENIYWIPFNAEQYRQP